MFTKNLILGILILIFIFTSFAAFLLIKNKPKIIPDRDVTIDEKSTTEKSEQECIEMEKLNIKDNKYIIGSELSVAFYNKPSAEVLQRLVQQYDLEVIQNYDQPRVVFKISEEKAPTIKCRLKNEPEVKDIVFIESIPVPNDEVRDENSKVIDFSLCQEDTGYQEYVGFGSTSLSIKKDLGDTCEVEISNEMEGGYTVYSCNIPKSLGKISIELTAYGSDFNSILKYCKEISSGNLLENLQN
jgi:hypothetical protein